MMDQSHDVSKAIVFIYKIINIYKNNALVNILLLSVFIFSPSWLNVDDLLELFII